MLFQSSSYYSQVLKISFAMFVYGQWLPGNMWHHIVWHTQAGVFNCQYSSCTWKTCPLRFISKNMHITKQRRIMFTEALWIGLWKFQSRFTCELLIVVTETGLIPPPNMECGALKRQSDFQVSSGFSSSIASVLYRIKSELRCQGYCCRPDVAHSNTIGLVATS